MMKGNAGSLKTSMNRCPKEPAFQLNLVKSKTSESAMVIVFSRELSQAGMFNIEIGKDINFKVGFRIFSSPLDE